jgi:L-amino acid N-acyltransferase YncA
MNLEIKIRPAVPIDTPRITAIYNAGIRARIATFETRERSQADILEWFRHPAYPFLVATRGDEVLGWIRASSYRARDCYAGIAEYSVYIAPEAAGKRVGDALMTAFVPALETAGFWKVLSRIFPENSASRSLCQRHGFREVGVYERHAKLDGVWKDVVIVEKLIGTALEE